MTLLDKSAAFLWLSTFVLLLAFIIYDAVAKANGTDASDPDKFAISIAAIGLVLAFALFASLIVTVLSAYKKRYGGRK